MCFRQIRQVETLENNLTPRLLTISLIDYVDSSLTSCLNAFEPNPVPCFLCLNVGLKIY